MLVHETLRDARTRLQETQALFESAIRASPDAIAIVRLTDNRILLVNASFERQSGYREAEAVGRTSIELQLWADPVQREAWLAGVPPKGPAREFEARFRMRDGHVRHCLVTAERVDILGSPCVVLVSHDVSERRRREDLVARIAQGVAGETGEPFFRSLVRHLAQALGADMAFVGEIDPADSARVRTIAVEAGDGPGADFDYALEGSPCEEILGRGVCAFPSGVAAQFPRDAELARQGIEAYVGAPLRDSTGRPLGLIAVLFRRPLEDALVAESLLRIFAVRASGEMERGRHVRALEHLAHHDPLTGLPNRVLFRHQLEAGLAPGGDGRGGRGALLLIDLDRFKEINDTLGHPVGDILLVRVARLLEEGMASASRGCIARLGGDEFAVWIREARDAAAGEAAAARALELLTAPIEVEGYRLEVGASVGIALAPTHAQTPSGLMRCADVAMYAAKRRGVGHALYDASQDPYSTQRLELLSELGEAVRAGQMRVHYQPRVGLAEGKVRSFEALVRWAHPRHGLLSPARFVPLAELSDVIRPLTLWVLDESLRQLREWHRAGHRARLSVNLSARHLMDTGCAAQVRSLLERHAVEASDLELEITESALIADPERATDTLARIRGLGVRLAIDDFGTGFSSLSHLRRLPLDALKIDVSFVKQMLASAADRAIVESTIHLAHDLGFAVVAEGIEDPETFEALRVQGCDEGQGYHIARPMPGEAVPGWLAARAA